jgi:hypothetical protein
MPVPTRPGSLRARMLVLPVAALGLLALSACSGGSSSDTSDTSDSSASTAGSGTAAGSDAAGSGAAAGSDAAGSDAAAPGAAGGTPAGMEELVSCLRQHGVTMPAHRGGRPPAGDANPPAGGAGAPDGRPPHDPATAPPGVDQATWTSARQACAAYAPTSPAGS